LFISIHTNAAPNASAYGIETFFLNLATDEDAILVAARENATSTKNISDLQSILSDLMQNAKINESSRLAATVQNAVVSHLNGRFNSIKNKGVKKAPFYVLLGAQMPSILLETAFISNERECQRLVSPEYQDHLADSILIGVEKYIRDTNPAAFVERQRGTSKKL
ncbi:MAG: N-acetylmuramoyl-L-alanine amidase, partial [Desulfatirhabdiaceae bacterium]